MVFYKCNPRDWSILPFNPAILFCLPSYPDLPCHLAIIPFPCAFLITIHVSGPAQVVCKVALFVGEESEDSPSPVILWHPQSVLFSALYSCQCHLFSTQPILGTISAVTVLQRRFFILKLWSVVAILQLLKHGSFLSNNLKKLHCTLERWCLICFGCNTAKIYAIPRDWLCCEFSS